MYDLTQVIKFGFIYLFLKNLFQFDRQRKSKPGYVELRSSSDNQELEAKAREEFRAKYRANKKRIMDATKEKPSLIERHNKVNKK